MIADEIEARVLANGTRLYLAPMPDRASISLGVYTHTGSRFEPGRLAGISHFTEHMLFKGTPRRSARQIALQSDRLGAALNAFTTEDHTCYHARCPRRSVGPLARMLADMYVESTFPEKEIERERSVIKDEIAIYHEQPSSLVEELLAEAAWPGHALGRSILGTPRTLERCRREDFLDYRQSAHIGKRTVVVATGALTGTSVGDDLAGLFESLPGGRRAALRRFHPDGDLSHRLRSSEWDLEQTHVALGFHTGGRGATDIHATRLLSVLLGETMSSRLFYQLREKRGYGYAIYSNRELFEEQGLLSISAGLDAGKALEAFDIVLRELDALRQHGPRERELREAVRWLIDQNEMAMEDAGTAMFWIGECALSPGTVMDDEVYHAALRRLRPADIQAAARRVFRSTGASLAVVGRSARSTSETMAEKLRRRL